MGVPTSAVFWPFNAVMLWLAAQDFDLHLPPGSTTAESLLYFAWLTVNLTLLLRWSVSRGSRG